MLRLIVSMYVFMCVNREINILAAVIKQKFQNSSYEENKLKQRIKILPKPPRVYLYAITFMRGLWVGNEILNILKFHFNSTRNLILLLFRIIFFFSFFF